VRIKQHGQFWDIQHQHPLQAVLYEGKIITDKTYGHATYGCIICCGYDSTGFDPYTAYGSVDATTTVSAMGTNTCTNISQSIDDFFSTWWPSNASIFTMSVGSMTGVSVGTGTTNASTTTLPVGGQGMDRPPYCPQRPAVNQGTGNVPPTISGGNIVWWFNGQNPDSTDYPISVKLTSSAGSSTTWAVTQKDIKVNLSSTNGATTTVTSTGKLFSASSGDITITATANGVSSSPFSMTAKTPWKLVPSSINTVCYASPQTYGTQITYNVVDSLSNTMSSDIYWNESLGTATCADGSNWCNGQISTGGGDSNPLTDILGPPNLNLNPAPVPMPICSGQGTGTTLYRSIPQTINVGGSVTGQGVQAQQDNLTYYIDHGQHNNIQSPTQPPQ
jgi:hypothetical protein